MAPPLLYRKVLGEFMRTLTYNRTLKAALIISALVLLSACGAQKSFNPSDSNDQSSTAPNASKAVCSQNIVSDGAKIQVMAYYDSYKQYYPNKYRVKLASIPADWKANDYDLTLRLVAVSSTGVVSTGATVPFTFDYRYGNSYVSINTQYPVVGASTEILSIAKYLNITPTTTTYANFDLQAFFNTAHIVGTSNDTAGAYQILRLEFRAPTTAGNGAVVKYYDTLLPVFTADPNEYAKTHHATLQALHPLKSYVGQSGFTQDQYKAFTDAYCF